MIVAVIVRVGVRLMNTVGDRLGVSVSVPVAVDDGDGEKVAVRLICPGPGARKTAIPPRQ